MSFIIIGFFFFGYRNTINNDDNRSLKTPHESASHRFLRKRIVPNIPEQSV